MKANLYVLVPFFFFKAISAFSQTIPSESSVGCGVGLKSSNGIFFSNLYSTAVYSVNITSIDSVEFTLYAASCIIGISSFTRNGENVPYITVYSPFSSTKKIRALGLPGKYSLSFYLPSIYTTPQFEFVSNTVSLKEVQKNAEIIKVYPNPARDFISVTSEKELLRDVCIKNSLGEEVKRLNIVSTNLEIPINDLPTGIYFIYLTSTSGSLAVRKILVQ